MRPEIRIETAVWPCTPSDRVAGILFRGRGLQPAARSAKHRLCVDRTDSGGEIVALTRRTAAEIAHAGGPRDPTLVRHLRPACYPRALRPRRSCCLAHEIMPHDAEVFGHVISVTSVIVGGALVIPACLLAQRRGEPGWIADAAARARIERLAMQAVMDAEQAQGHAVVDVSAQYCGWDITSIPPARDGKLPPSRHIEVKGRAKGQTTITVTRNEILYGLNQADKFILAIVLVDGEGYEGPFYVKNPFTHEPDWAVTSENLDLHALLSRAEQAYGW